MKGSTLDDSLEKTMHLLAASGELSDFNLANAYTPTAYRLLPTLKAPSGTETTFTWSYQSRLEQVHSGHHPACPPELLPFTLGPPLDWLLGLGPPGPPADIIFPLLLPNVPPPPIPPPPPEVWGGKVWPPP